jgi:hypothetical protein
MQTEREQKGNLGSWLKLKPESKRIQSKRESKDPRFTLKTKVGQRAALVASAGRRLRAGGKLPSLPPNLMMTPTFAQVLRFQSHTGNESSITVQDLASACGGIAATAVLFYPWASSIRLTKITLWPSVESTAGTPQPCELTWAVAASGGYAPDDSKDCTPPFGMTLPHCMVFRPPKKSLSADWLTVSLAGDVLFTVQSPPGSIVDIEVLCRMSNNLAPFSSGAVTGATPGAVLWGGLDTLTTGGNYVAVGRPTPP